MRTVSVPMSIGDREYASPKTMLERHVAAASAPQQASGDVRYAHPVWRILVWMQAFLLHLSPDEVAVQSAESDDMLLSSGVWRLITEHWS